MTRAFTRPRVIPDCAALAEIAGPAASCRGRSWGGPLSTSPLTGDPDFCMGTRLKSSLRGLFGSGATDGSVSDGSVSFTAFNCRGWVDD